MLILEAYRDIGDIRGTSPVCPGGIGGHTGHTPLGVSRVPSRVPVNGPIRNVPVKTRQGQKNGMLLLRKNFSARPTSSPGLSGLHIPTTSALEGKLFHGRVRRSSRKRKPIKRKGYRCERLQPNSTSRASRPGAGPSSLQTKSNEWWRKCKS
jgi:hypothetical protein